ncbi:hypothetical protein D6783_02925 [Candidatus Woesearchaeota archaeon]|nr:MAG: hypothetical protein D6783_02925 [Candidatus Woesearchaeota archaeon]
MERVAIIHKPHHQVVVGGLIFVAAVLFGLTTVLDGVLSGDDVGFLYVIVLPLLLIAASLITGVKKAYHRVIYRLELAGLREDQVKAVLERAGFDPVKVNEAYPFIKKLLANYDRFRYGSFFSNPMTLAEQRILLWRNLLSVFTILVVFVFLVLVVASQWFLEGLVSKATIQAFNVLVFFLMLVYFGAVEHRNNLFYESNKERYVSLILHGVIVFFFFVVLPVLYAFLKIRS